MHPALNTVLALAPGTRHMGVALFAGGHLVYFGVKSFPGKKSGKKLMRLATECAEGLIARYRPDAMAIESPYYAQARLCAPLLKLTSHLRILGRRHGLRVLPVLPTEPKRYFCVSKPTRRNLAKAMALRYSYLSIFLREHRTWIYWQQMFDAVGLGAFVVSRIQEKRRARTEQAFSQVQPMAGPRSSCGLPRRAA